MKVVIAVDSFKGSISTQRSGEAIAKGIRQVYDNAEIIIRPLADGGEGTVEAIVSACNGRLREAEVTGPLGEKVTAPYGILKDEGIAIIEMSAAAGLPLVSEDKRDPMHTTTYGVGELILHAIRSYGCRRFIIGIGGSATNDGGVGMLQALGFSFLDEKGKEIDRGALGLSKLCRISRDNAAEELSECEFTVACDVKNVLCGESGCSAVYGRQKGATDESIPLMDGWLKNYASLTSSLVGKDMSSYPGAGAAGGMGFAFISYLGATLKPGIDIVTEVTRLEDHVKDADVVVTGEGRLDGQTVMGKAPIGVARIAKKYNKTVIAFCGTASPDAVKCNDHCIDAFFPVLQKPCTLAEAMDETNAYNNLASTSEQAFRLIRRISSEGRS